MEEAEQVMQNMAPQPGGRHESTSASSAREEGNDEEVREEGAGNTDSLVSEVLRDMGAPPSPT